MRISTYTKGHPREVSLKKRAQHQRTRDTYQPWEIARENYLALSAEERRGHCGAVLKSGFICGDPAEGVRCPTHEAGAYMPCWARSHDGSPCLNHPHTHPITGFFLSWKCRLHGGMSTGPKVRGDGTPCPRNIYAGWAAWEIKAFEEAMDKND